MVTAIAIGSVAGSEATLAAHHEPPSRYSVTRHHVVRIVPVLHNKGAIDLNNQPDSKRTGQYEH